jgi:hypothetical protein
MIMVDWTAFWSHWGWPVATAFIASVFTFLLLRQFLERRKYHQMAWTIGFLMFAIAAFMEGYSEFVNNWNPTVYRIYIVLAGVLVGFLGLGTFYLIVRNDIIGHIYLIINFVLMGVFLFGTFTVDLIDEALVAGVTVGGDPLGASGSFPRVMSMVFTIPGSILLIGGSIYSIIFFARKKQFSYRVWANVLIILGTLIIAGAGGRARAGDAAGLYPAEMLAAVLLLWGFLKAATLKKGAEIKKELRKEMEDKSS